MAKVFLLSFEGLAGDDDYNRGAYLRLKCSAEQGRFRDHGLTSDADAADLILFAELKGAGPYFEIGLAASVLPGISREMFHPAPTLLSSHFCPASMLRLKNDGCQIEHARDFISVFPKTNFSATDTAARDDLPYLYSFAGLGRERARPPSARRIATSARVFSRYVCGISARPAWPRDRR